MIKKIEYYILNDFQLDKKLINLYKKFNLEGKNNINSLKILSNKIRTKLLKDL